MSSQRPSEVRAELLQRHAELRSRIDDMRELIDALWRGEQRHHQLRVCLFGLAEVVERHCAHEQDILGDLIRTIDAWGDARADLMLEEHRTEHRDVRATLAASDGDELLKLASELADRMLAHLDVEERVLLAEDVLHDGIVARNSFTG